MTTGELLVVPVSADALDAELARLEPAELLAPASWADRPPAVAERLRVTRRPDVLFDPGIAFDELCRHYGVRSLEGFGLRPRTPPPLAAARRACSPTFARSSRPRSLTFARLGWSARARRWRSTR